MRRDLWAWAVGVALTSLSIFAVLVLLSGTSVPPVLAQVSGGGNTNRAVQSSQMPDPYTPTDGTWNLTGNETATGTQTANAFSSTTTVLAGGNVCGGSSVVCMGNTAIHSGVELIGAAGSSLWASGQPTDGAGAIGVEIGSFTNLTVGGAKAVRFCNNLTSGACSELGYVDRDGTINITAWSVGGGAIVNKHIEGSTTQDVALFGPLADATFAFAVPGAADGDRCSMGVANAVVVTGLRWECYVSAVATVTVRLTCVNGAAGTCDPGNGAYNVSLDL